MGENIKIISWNVMELNRPNNRGDVRHMLHNFFSDIGILLRV